MSAEKPDSRAGSPDPMSTDVWSGFVIVRLRPEQNDVDADTLIDLARRAKLDALVSALTAAGLPDSLRTLRGVAADKIRDLERKAAATKVPPLHSLTAYWRIDMRQRRDKIDLLVDRLASVPEVDHAYREYSVTDPAVNYSNDVHANIQNYLKAAPEGIGARWVWTQPNSDGAGVGFVDLERTWNFTHEDIVVHFPPLPFLYTAITKRASAVSLAITEPLFSALSLAKTTPSALWASRRMSNTSKSLRTTMP